MQHASVCNKHLSIKQLQVLSSLKCKSCTPRNVLLKGKYTFSFVKQNLLFILFSGVQFHLFYLNSKHLFKQDYIKNQRRRKIHQRRQLVENTRIKISGCFVYFYFNECTIAYDQFQGMLYFLANKVADFYYFSDIAIAIE